MVFIQDLPPDRFNSETVRNQSNAYELCQDIHLAAELMKKSVEISEIAERAATRVTMTNLFKNLPFTFEVTIPEDAEAFVTDYADEVIDSNPKIFEGTEIDSIGALGVEFYNGITKKWLTLKSFDFEIHPIFE